MNKDILKNKWNEVKDKVKEQWVKFTHDDISKMKGSYRELCNNLHKKYGYEKEQAKKEVEGFLEKQSGKN